MQIKHCVVIKDKFITYGKRKWGIHDDVIKWKYFSRYWPFVRGIDRSPVNSLHKGPWRFEVFFDLRLNKWLSKRSWGWWFETPSHLLRYHCNDNPTHYADVWFLLPYYNCGKHNEINMVFVDEQPTKLLHCINILKFWSSDAIHSWFFEDYKNHKEITKRQIDISAKITAHWNLWLFQIILRLSQSNSYINLAIIHWRLFESFTLIHYASGFLLPTLPLHLLVRFHNKKH